MTRATRDLSLVTNTPQGYRSTLVAGGGWELFDSTVAAEMDFFVPEEAIVLGARLRVKLRPWLSFEKDVSSGGGSTSGASSTGSTASGGSSAPTSSTQDNHNHQMTNDLGSAVAPGVWSRHEARNGDGGSTFGFTVGLNPGGNLWTYGANGSHSHSVTIGSHTHTHAHDHETPNHQHQVVKGIHLESGFPGAVSILLDDINVDSLIDGPFTATAGRNIFEGELDGQLANPGWHSITAETASGLGRIQTFVVLDLLTLG